jgi:predicted ferric reductase
MRRWVLGGVVAGVVGAVLMMSVAARLGIVAVLVQRPDTHEFWYYSRAAGISAYLALALSVIWGLLLSTRLVDTRVPRGRGVELHTWLSAVALALIAAHALLLLGDPYVRFDVVDVVLPFASAYRPAAVALGVLSAYGTAIVFGSFWLRRHIGQRTWRIVHILVFPTFVGVTLHGLLAGSDSATAWMRITYLVCSALVIWLLVYRLVSKTTAAPSTSRVLLLAVSPDSSR